MSDIKSQLDVDIRGFLEDIETQTLNDRIVTLKNMFDKYIHLSTCEHLMSFRDLGSIISESKKKFTEIPLPVQMGKNRNHVSPADIPNLCVVESTISFLNKNGCLKKIPKFDIKK